MNSLCYTKLTSSSQKLCSIRGNIPFAAFRVSSPGVRPSGKEENIPAIAGDRIPATLKVLLVDDVTLVRKALRRLLEADQSFQVCGEASNGMEALRMAQELQPDVIVMDLSMPVMNGLDATRELRRTLPSARVLMVTENDSEHVMKAARDAGVHGYLAKSLASDLREAIHALHERKEYFRSSPSPR